MGAFTPVGKMIDERAVYIRSKNSAGADNSKEIAALNAQGVHFSKILEVAPWLVPSWALGAQPRQTNKNAR